MLGAMPFRCIGPPRGGRVVAVAGDPSNPAVFYFGAVAGGIWKTDDAGTTWRNISDGQLKTSAVGALTVSESDPNVIYAGMGESTIRIDVSHGDGVYRSGDGGQTWTHCGLTDTRFIGEIRIHPKDPDHVYVAALGHAFGPNEERGLFRSTDGGTTWDKVLYVSDKAGAVDVTFDPRNPDVVYATMWEAHRNFWELSSGGSECGIWKSTDGGDTWTDISRNTGLPQTALLGKIGVAASPVKAGRVWALIEASDDPGLYRSDDFGETWELLTDNQDLRYRPWYYMHIFADPQDADTVYVNNLEMWRSDDGGKTFTGIPTPHGDNHDLWIDPNDNRRMIQGNDGGANVSFNRAESWSTIYNQLTAQFYVVTTDNREPYYHVYGTQQDNSSVAVPSATNDDAIVWADCYAAGTGESGFMAVHPEDDDIVYVGAVGSSPGGGGALQRYDRRSGQIQLVNVWPELHGGIGPGELTYRFPWTFPILFSPHDSNIIYTAGNVVFRTTDEGHSWEPISGDLTRNDPSKLGVSGGPISKDTSGAEHYCTVSTLRESPHEPGVLWAGSDDGLVHLSRDNGATWTDVTPPELPEWSFIRTVEPSPHDPASLYLAATRYKLDDNTPYLYKTTDYGQTWHSLTTASSAVGANGSSPAGGAASSIPDDDFVRVIRADPQREGLLYVGTETGLYVSLDDGTTWRRWESNLPITPVYDLEIKGTDLVVATHGRSFWILDDLTPLRELNDAVADSAAHLFAPGQVWRVVPDLFAAWISTDGKDYAIGLGKAATFIASKTETGHIERSVIDAGQSSPLGLIVSYYLSDDAAAAAAAALTEGGSEEGEAGASVSLSFLDSSGELIRFFSPKPDGFDKRTDDEKAHEPGPWMSIRPGLNQFRWDLRYAGSTKVLGNKLAAEANQGPLITPGSYQVRLVVGGEDGSEQTLSEPFEVVQDPRVDASHSDLEEQRNLLLQVRDKISQVHEGMTRLRQVRTQVVGWRERMSSVNGSASYAEAIATATDLEAKLNTIEDALILPGEHKDTFGLNERSRLNEKLASLISVVASADTRPTTQ
ncbi:MAG: glycosyl hydrolase, partial [Actinomycetia bacterium]|nr:glycosyl hydrolase [Actinomycetes bacterium]